jgi:pilus assembly protein Flp/PilA
MRKPIRACAQFLREQQAVTSLEYALLGVLIAVTCVATLSVLGGNVGALYATICNSVSAAISGAPAC